MADSQLIALVVFAVVVLGLALAMHPGRRRSNSDGGDGGDGSSIWRGDSSDGGGDAGGGGDGGGD
jgi:hypothetical protein